MKVGQHLTLGPVHLIVRDEPQMMDYYQSIIGLVELGRSGEEIILGVGNIPLVILHVNPAAELPGSPQPGLFHLALLVPTRLDLAIVLRHLIEQNEPLGASDHGVSEALYLNDPEGNGIEIYADRPRDRWPVNRETGRLEIFTRRLDSQDLLAQIGPEDKWQGLPPGTTIGHVHLRVSDISRAKAFYVDMLGFDFIQDYGNSAGFVSVNGYHHHLGFNTWETRGKSPAPSDATGLKLFEIHLSSAEESAALAAELGQNGGRVKPFREGYLISDPDEIAIYLRGK